MVKKSEYTIHGCFLIAIFIIGNTLIYFPKKNDIKSSILGVIIAAGISVLGYFAFAFLSKRMGLNDIGKKSKPFVFFFLSITCFLVSLISSSDYISYVSVFRMPNTERIIISVIFIALSFYLAIQRRSVIFKIALICFIYVFLSVSVLFALSFSQLDFKAILPLEFKSFETVKSMLTCLTQSFLSAVPLVVLIKTEKLKTSVKVWLIALFLGLFVLLICMLNILFIFGPDLSNNLELPYASAMSVINLGKTFFRLEGFSYLNYFACSIIKTAAPLYVIRKMADEYFNKKGIYFLIPVCLALIVLSLINGLTDFLYSIFFSFLLLVFEVLSIVLLGIFAEKKKL